MTESKSPEPTAEMLDETAEEIGRVVAEVIRKKYAGYDPAAVEAAVESAVRASLNAIDPTKRH